LSKNFQPYSQPFRSKSMHIVGSHAI
jgi:hypothetical protein